MSQSRIALRKRLPEIALEVGSVVFAVLFALGVNEWRDDRRKRVTAEQARQSIEAEVAENQEELRQALLDNTSTLREVGRLAGAVGSDSTLELQLGLTLASLSSAAFDASESAGVTATMDFQWLLSVARVYNLQGLYQRRQEQLLDQFSDTEGGSPAWLARFRGRLSQTQVLGDSLSVAYESILHAASPP